MVTDLHQKERRHIDLIHVHLLIYILYFTIVILTPLLTYSK